MQLAALTQEREEILCEIDNANTVLHPIRKCPPEILRRVFIEALPDISNKRKFDSLQPTWVAWTISRVCSQWRRVAVSYPALWSQIVINKPAPHINSLKHLITLLYRASKHPLTVSIVSAHATRNGMLFPILVGSAPSWEHLIVYDNPEILDWLSDATGSLGYLKSISFPSFLDPPSASVRNLFTLCGKLRAVNVSLFTLSSLQLPWSQLTDFKLGIIPGTAGQVAPIPSCLSLMANLQNFTIFSTRARLSGITSQSPVQILDVPCKRLRIEAGVREHWSILSKLRFPCLLQLEVATPMQAGDAECIGKLLGKCDFQLKHLFLDQVSCADTDLWSVLHPLKRLMRLRLMPFDVNSSFAKELLKSSTEEVLLPALQVLTVRTKTDRATFEGFGAQLAEPRPEITLYRI
jgi:hypothetical protein